MTERNFTKELLYSHYADMENGDDVESIDYRSLIHIMTEMMTRIEQHHPQPFSPLWHRPLTPWLAILWYRCQGVRGLCQRGEKGCG